MFPLLINLLTFLFLLPLASAIPTQAQTHTPETLPEVVGGHRRGVAYNDEKLTWLFNQGSNFKTSWMYNWDSSDNREGAQPWFEYSPMLWNDVPGAIRSFKAGAEKQWRQFNGYMHVLSFNEPDLCVPGAGASCIPIDTAVRVHREVIDPLRTWGEKMYIGSPAVSNAAAPAGLAYLADFLNKCAGCQIDFLCVHWYNDASNFEGLKWHIGEVRKISGGRPIWITEFGVTGTDDQIIAFFRQALPWLDSQPDIHRYAYLMAKPGKLVNLQGTGLSALGQVYNTL
ncbi:hypothetical protein CC80DRAFT_545910 [Byssothecium circinans]|uniref:Asl1-like glycosyl hydrolase catalytic domain-containing protein n=1 Tax=Byssothecium circinans TaxID=147558 RepID=A0A6A5U091_9PLEO|nr:hypothetical protein CC80DRAFT_545910 [Byssothecium circinans]